MKKLTLITCLMSAAMAASAQSLERQVIGSAGSYVSSGNISLSYTVGEVATTTLTGSNLILTQGFQQPDQQLVGMDEPGFLGEIKVYPNPTSDIVNFEIKTDQSGLTLVLTDVLGQDMLNRAIVLNGGSYSGQVDMSSYAAGNYVLYLRDANGKVVTSYKIQKLH